MTLPKGYKRPIFNRDRIKDYFYHPSDESKVLVMGFGCILMSYLFYFDQTIRPVGLGIMGTRILDYLANIGISPSIIFL